MFTRAYRPNIALFALLLLWACYQFAATSPVAVAEEAAPPLVRRVRDLETSRLGILNPAGLAFAPKAGAFHIISKRSAAQPTPTDTDLAQLLPTEIAAGVTKIAAQVRDPINVTFDGKWNRLLILKTPADQLVVVQSKADGTLDPKSTQHIKLKQFGLQNPQGMTVDPATGRLYILDAGGPRILQVEPDAAGGFDRSQVTTIPLPATIGAPRGLAWEPGEQLLYLLSPAQQTLYTLTLTGEVAATRSLATFAMSNPQAMLFAPTGDLTDDPERLNLYIADAGQPVQAAEAPTAPSEAAAPCPTPATCPNQLYLPLVAGGVDSGVSAVDEGTSGVEEVVDSAVPANAGAILELSLAPPPSTISAPSFSAALIRTVDLATISPPSPDPSGLTYLPTSNTLLMSDGEIEETVGGITHFQGANVWELTLGGNVVRAANISKVAPTVVPMSNEPTGTAWNPNNGHYYFSDDDTRRIYDLNPGADGLVGTADDTWTHFSTLAVGNTDPEGITVDTNQNRLFVVDGLNMEVYEYTLSGSFLSQFDVEQYGVLDPESVEYVAESGTLLVLSNHMERSIAETTTSGLLLRVMDITAANGYTPSGLVYAHASDGSGARRFYVLDRGVDNDVNPNIIDGRLHEMTAPDPLAPGFNTPPIVNAGPDQSVVLPNTLALNGTATDDGQPNPPGALVTTWIQLSGPGTATFANPNALVTTASFSVPGAYLLRLSAFDGVMTSSDMIAVAVTGSSNITAFEVRITAGSDDAEENSSNNVTTTSGDLDMMLDSGGATNVTNLLIGLRFPSLAIPPEAVITNAHLQFETDENHVATTQLTMQGEAANSAATFAPSKKNLSNRPRTTAAVTWTPPAWTHIGDAGPDQRTPDLAAILQEVVSRPGWASGNAIALLLTGSGQHVARAFEGDAAGAALLHIEYTTNQAPLVNAGPDQTIALPHSATLDATVSDDGLPKPPNLITTWSQISGPGAVTFGNVNAVDTTASFTDVGVYILRLTATDGALTSSDDLIITVSTNQAPVVNAGPDQTIALPSQATLDGAVSDDGFPLPPSVTTAWSQVDGPGTVAFGNSSAVDTTAAFSVAGVYTLRLTANDGALSSSDDLIITVNAQTNQAPLVNAGADQTILLSSSAALDGAVSDDGLPAPPSVITAWSQVSGPGAVTFANAEAVDTTATFSAIGVYVLRLTASDGALSAFDEVSITVNTAPAVNAGPDQTIALPSNANLDGTVSDDGFPLPPNVATTWSQVSGPGTVTFGNANAVDTTAAFTAPGAYTLRLTANDGAHTSNDDVIVTVTDLIFADGFEAGNLTAWSSSVTDGGNLSVSAAAALVGAQGLQALINDNNAIYVVDDRPTAEPRYRMRFYFDPNTMPMAANDSHQIFSGRAAAGTVVVQIEFRFSGGVYQLRALILDDGSSSTSSGWFTISDAPHAVEVDWRAATAAGTNNGGLTFWIDGVQKANVTGIDNDTRRIDLVRLGAGSGIDNGTRGAYYFDAYEARRQSYIGP
ncbi:MAG: hypothetical protein DYG89_28510 [Caldilinea sp. CFX5]|nr:hypothetical protein [Caldilinea sp. CFX5]